MRFRPEPTHCLFCKKMIVGEIRSFCTHCKEFFPEVEDRWFSTTRHGVLDTDHCTIH